MTDNLFHDHKPNATKNYFIPHKIPTKICRVKTKYKQATKEETLDWHNN